MGKSIYIAEKPSVAAEFAKALKCGGKRYDGFMEEGDTIVTWCFGHLVEMCYPDAYNPALKRWSLSTLPFLPDRFLYEIIASAKKQFDIVSGLLNRPDVETIYVCTDSGREGEYIYRLVEQMSGVTGKIRKRVWIDSQTEEEILKGIRTAKDLSEYDNLSASAYLRAKEDYLMGINFSRLLTLRYGQEISACMGTQRTVIAVGRVMTCVLGMVVRREREIRAFVPTPFFKVTALAQKEDVTLPLEWRLSDKSHFSGRPDLYKDSGFTERKTAEELISWLSEEKPVQAIVEKAERKTEKKNPPLLFNLAELQNECSRRFKLSPDQTLNIIQELYEKKLVTYPRTDARVLSTAIAKEITKNIKGLGSLSSYREYTDRILNEGRYKGLEKTRYVNDSQITDHYAIIPTGQGFNNLKTLTGVKSSVYDVIVRRFLSIFYPPAEYARTSLEFRIRGELFVAGVKLLKVPGYLEIAGIPKAKTDAKQQEVSEQETDGKKKDNADSFNDVTDPRQIELIASLKKGMVLDVPSFDIREGKTSAPVRYNSGSIILAMENAGQLIEDEDLRAQIKGSGIGTSATRAETLKKLVNNGYLNLNEKTQIITPELLGEVIYDVVFLSIRSLLSPDLTASWEKGLTYVANGELTEAEYMDKLKGFIIRRTNAVMGMNNASMIQQLYDQVQPFYARKTSQQTAKKAPSARTPKKT